MANGGSPKKLQRSIRNQLQALPSTRPSGVQQLTLSLRNISLSSPPSPSSRVLTAIQIQCQLYSRMILILDLSYSVLDPHTLACLCSLCPSLESLTAACCGLEGTEPDTPWPVHLRTVDFSRNRLRKIPLGFPSLLHLQKLNLSGNHIDHLDPTLLRIPHLEKLYLLKNPIKNMPKAICRSTVQEMRKFLQIQPLLLPPSGDSDATSSTRALPIVGHRSLRSSLLQMRMESFESGYNSGAQLASTSSCSSLESEGGRAEDPALSPTWPKFSPSLLPHGYTEQHSSHSNLCQVFLPPGAPGCVAVEEVKELSLHPRLPKNHLLITAVVRVSPHGMAFSADKPAILVLSHCTRPSAVCEERVAVLCSNTSHSQQPQWRQMPEDTPRTMYEKCVMFSTTHFSLFAAALVMPYHSASLIIGCNEGGKLTVPECPGFEVTVLAGSLPPGGGETITGTVYYTDPPTPDCSDGPEAGLSLASPVVGLEPHGIQFIQPVTVSLPVPDYAAIMSAVHGASLQLWTASPSEGALQWSRVSGVDLSLEPSDGGTHTASFLVSHFSFFELLWDVCRDTLVRLGYGASLVYSSLRAHYVAVRCQVFMTPPLQDLTFALLVVVYKFGEQLRQLGNYPWLLADSGERRVFLQTGELVAQLDGCFKPRRECGESGLSQALRLSFSGQDFSLRFAFALKLNSLQLPLQDYQAIGKLRMRQQNGATAMELNLIKPAHTAVCLPAPSTPVSWSSQPVPSYMDFTPPWSPEHDHLSSNEEEDPFLISPPITTSSAMPTTPPLIGKRRPQTQLTQGRAKRKLLLREARDISDQLLMKIAKHIGSKWEEVGVALELDFATIVSVAGEGQTEHMKAFHVLQEWKRVAAERLTFGHLATALEEAGLKSCAYEHCYSSSVRTDREPL